MSTGTAYVFEIVNASDEETYFSLAMFSAEAEAIAALGVKEPPCDTSPGESVKIEVRRRKLGWGDDYKVVLTREWVEEYDAADDSYAWKIKPIAQ